MYRREALIMVDVKETLSSKAAIKKRIKRLKRLYSEGEDKKEKMWQRKRKISKSRPKNLKCFQCHKEGHFKNDCLELKNKDKYTKEKSGEIVVISEVQEFDGDESIRVFIAAMAKLEVIGI